MRTTTTSDLRAASLPANDSARKAASGTRIFVVFSASIYNRSFLSLYYDQILQFCDLYAMFFRLILNRDIHEFCTNPLQRAEPHDCLG